jgi:hypothetical protein
VLLVVAVVVVVPSVAAVVVVPCVVVSQYVSFLFQVHFLQQSIRPLTYIPNKIILEEFLDQGKVSSVLNCCHEINIAI